MLFGHCSFLLSSLPQGGVQREDGSDASPRVILHPQAASRTVGYLLQMPPVVVSEQDLKAVDVADAAQQAYFLIGGVGKVVEQVFADVPDIIPSILTKAGYITLSLDEQPYWV